MEMKRVETFTLNKRKFVYIDISRIRSNSEFKEFVAGIKEYFKDFKPQSVYTITNVEGITFDSATKDIVEDLLISDSEYVIYAAVINIDGIKKIMFNSVIKASKRDNIRFFNTRQQAVEWLSEV